MDWAAKMIELAEMGAVRWEAIARECLAQMNCDDSESVATALELDQEDWITEA